MQYFSKCPFCNDNIAPSSSQMEKCTNIDCSYYFFQYLNRTTLSITNYDFRFWISNSYFLVNVVPNEKICIYILPVTKSLAKTKHLFTFPYLNKYFQDFPDLAVLKDKIKLLLTYI